MADAENGKLCCFNSIHFVVHVEIGKGRSVPRMLETVYFNFDRDNLNKVKIGGSVLNGIFKDKVITVRQQEGENS